MSVCLYTHARMDVWVCSGARTPVNWLALISSMNVTVDVSSMNVTVDVSSMNVTVDVSGDCCCSCSVRCRCKMIVHVL